MITLLREATCNQARRPLSYFSLSLASAFQQQQHPKVVLTNKLCWEPLTSRTPRTGLCSAHPLRLHALSTPKPPFAVRGVHFHQATLCTPAWSYSSCSTGRHHFDLAGKAHSIASSSAADRPRCRVSVSRPPIGSPYASDRLALNRTVYRQHSFVELRPLGCCQVPTRQFAE